VTGDFGGSEELFRGRIEFNKIWTEKLATFFEQGRRGGT